MHRLQSIHDAKEHPAYWAEDNDELPKQRDCVECGADKSCFTNECHDGIMWVCPDCGKEQYE